VVVDDSGLWGPSLVVGVSDGADVGAGGAYETSRKLDGGSNCSSSRRRG
jgi:hypothetical protein